METLVTKLRLLILFQLIIIFFSVNQVLAIKPLPPINVELVPGNPSVSIGDSMHIECRLYPEADISNVIIEVWVEGNIGYFGGGKITLGALQNGVDEKVYIPVQVNPQPGKGKIKVNVLSLNPQGEVLFSRASSLYFLSDQNEVSIGRSGFLNLELERLDKKYKERKPLYGSERYKQYQKELDVILGGGATETNESIQPKDITLNADGTLTIYGQIIWTDSAGNTHPVRSAPVEIRDDELIGSDLVTTVITDLSGNYAATIDNDDGALQNGRDIFIRVLAKSDGFDIMPPGLLGSIYRIDSSVHPDLTDGTSLTINLTANNTDENNTAFSIHDALVTAHKYVLSEQGFSLDSIPVIYPTNDVTSNYDGSDLDILLGDRFDWDVIHHEYGHYVADKLNIENNPGGPHGLGENLAETRGKDIGMRLAWGEGWPTYFAVSLQQVAGVGSFNIGISDSPCFSGTPVGDTQYQDTDDTCIIYDLESQTGGSSLGEDNELSVQRILYDLYDNNNDAGDEVSLGDTVIWDTLNSDDSVNLSEAWNALKNSQSIATLVQYGSIFSEHKVAPDPTTPDDNFLIGFGGTLPTFEWDINGGGPSHRNNRFTVEFYNTNFTQLIFSSPELTVNKYTPSESDLNMILSGGVIINWFVKGRNTNEPETGMYFSRARSIVPGALDLIFTIDVTGSMFDDIAAVKTAAADIINKIDSKVGDYRIALVTYKDFPTLPFGGPSDFPFKTNLSFTSDNSSVISAIQALTVGGGADFEESVHSALMHSISLPWRDGVKKAIILMGDAPPHDPEPFTGFTAATVIAAAEAVDPAQIYPIAVGFSPATRAAFSALAEGTGGVLFEAPTAADVVDAIIEAIGGIIEPTNQPPNCTFAVADPNHLWPPNHKLVPITILGVDDPDDEPVTLTITDITQDEPVFGSGSGNTAPDGIGLGTETAEVRAERAGPGNSRVYKISFVASDDKGAECNGSVLVAVPHDQGENTTIVDDGQNYDSTEEP